MIRYVRGRPAGFLELEISLGPKGWGYLKFQGVTRIKDRLESKNTTFSWKFNVSSKHFFLQKLVMINTDCLIVISFIACVLSEF